MRTGWSPIPDGLLRAERATSRDRTRTGKTFVGSFWPSERQKLLLRAALLDDERGADAWRSLRPGFDLDDPEVVEQRLLPLVYRQLDRLGIDDPALPKLRGIYRRTWYVNQLVLDRLKSALKAVQDGDAEPLVVSSWELPARYYRDLGLRPVERLHLLVRPGQVRRAARTLSEAGWSGPLEPSEAFLRGRHNAVYRAANGDVCVLYWRLFHEFSVPERVEPEDLFAPAVGFELGGVSVRGLSPTDELLNVCVGGARLSHWPSLTWIPDSFAVLRAPDSEIDWERLVRQAMRLRATLRVHDALSFLRQELDAPVPEGAIEELRTAPTRRREVLAHRAAGRRLGMLGPMPDTFTRFLRLTADERVTRALAGLPTFLRDEWGLDRRSQVPLAALRRGGGMIVGATRAAKLKRNERAARAARAATARGL
jgi:hypothetical protein